jgi:hypothetical protein
MVVSSDTIISISPASLVLRPIGRRSSADPYRGLRRWEMRRVRTALDRVRESRGRVAGSRCPLVDRWTCRPRVRCVDSVLEAAPYHRLAEPIARYRRWRPDVSDAAIARRVGVKVGTPRALAGYRPARMVGASHPLHADIDDSVHRIEKPECGLAGCGLCPLSKSCDRTLAARQAPPCRRTNAEGKTTIRNMKGCGR